jgi:hypothetical protein
MDAIDILGGLLGHKSSRSKRSGGSKTGTDILSDIFGGKSKRSSGPSATDLDRKAKELEEILNVSKDHHDRPSSATRSSSRDHDTSHSSSGSLFPHSGSTTAPTSGSSLGNDVNDKALILVQAMINAAKSDGQIDQAEQQTILQRFEGSSSEAIQFLREEFRKPLDVRQFASTVPLGMETQVYAMSLMAINLDSGDEAKYLMDLSQALRISAEDREQLHQRYNAPSIY